MKPEFVAARSCEAGARWSQAHAEIPVAFDPAPYVHAAWGTCILKAWCVLTSGIAVQASSNQRVQDPRGQEPDRPLAGPRHGERSSWPKRGVESLYGGSKSAGRNIK